MRDIEDDKRAGFAGSLGPGMRPALLLVDPARAYADPDCPLFAGAGNAVEAMRALLAAGRAERVPVFITRVLLRKNGLDGGVFFRKVPALKWLTADSPYSSYIDGLEPTESDLEVTKQYPSAFAGTSLAASLRALGVDTVVMGGFSTSGCIRASATDAMQNGFVPIVVRDAVGDRHEGQHQANLFDIQAKIGEVVSLEAGLDILRGVKDL